LPEITDDYMQAMLAQSKSYTTVLLRMTEKAAEPGARQIIWEHGRRNFALREEGKLPIVCRGNDDTDLAGIGIFAASPEEVAAIMEDDPGVKAGLFMYELHPVLGFRARASPDGCRSRARPRFKRLAGEPCDAGIVGCERQGPWAYYFVIPCALEELAG
jgi:hypothetical protein